MDGTQGGGGSGPRLVTAGGFEHPTGCIPRSVAFVAAGPSKMAWVDYQCATERAAGDCDEVWTLNGVGRVVRSDLSFIMDDYASIRGHLPDLARWYESCPHPIITSQPRPECPTAIAYPLADVLNLPCARPYLNHTAAYVIAYAIVLGVKHLYLFGCDYISQDAPYRTGKERSVGAARYMACASFWSGYAAARGMEINVPSTCPMLDADSHENDWFYGYTIKPKIGRVKAKVAA
jgi:hypothetical protein